MLAHRYRLLSQVGRGGMGRVWHAHDDLLHRDVAVKEVIFPPGLTASDREVLFERTLREARSAARLSHPGIVTVHDVVEEDGRPWIVMELVRARSLQKVIDTEGRLPVDQVADIGVQMLAALRNAHGAGVLHRDVKPANVLLDTGGYGAARVVITDFGIARMEGDATLTQTGLLLGSPAYIAPERARGEPASAASDLWALGATLYAACEGRSPHDRAEAMAALAAVLQEEPERPCHAGPLTPVLMGLLVKDPAVRLTADQTAADLTRIVRGEVPSPPSGDTPAGMTQNWRDIPEQTSWTQHYAAGPAGPLLQPDATVRQLGVPMPDFGDGGGTGSGAGPAAPPSRRRLILGAVAVAVLLVVVSVVVLLSRHTAHGSSGRLSSPSPMPSSATPTATSTLSPTPTPGASLPAGFHRSPGPGGASIAVPAGWRRQILSADSVRWMQPSTGAHIQVDAIPWDVEDPAEHWRRFETEVVSKNHLPGFREIRLSGRFEPRGWPASDLEYTWSTRDHGTLRAYDRGFTAGGRQYALLVAAPAGQWSDYADLLDTIYGSFEPA